MLQYYSSLNGCSSFSQKQGRRKGGMRVERGSNRLLSILSVFGSLLDTAFSICGFTLLFIRQASAVFTEMKSRLILAQHTVLSCSSLS
ncbi:uncharacterized [Tachysurus ichikawai]